MAAILLALFIKNTVHTINGGPARTPEVVEVQSSWTQLESQADSARKEDIDDMDIIPAGWIMEDAPDVNDPIELTIALSQSNVDRIDDVLMSVSDPTSPEYGKHWDFKKIHDFLAPSEDAVRGVYSSLESNDISEESIKKITPNGDFIKVSTTIGVANQLLNTKYRKWYNLDSDSKYYKDGNDTYSN